MSAIQILVVEDERIVANGIKNDLEMFGYEVVGIASTADEAIKMAVERQPHLVLMDIHLEGDRDGIEAAAEIHSRTGLPVVYLSAFADADTVAKAKQTGSFGYLLKPYEEWELLTTIEMALARFQTEQRLADTERWLAAILEGIDDCVIAADANNLIHVMNRASNSLTGWDSDSHVGATYSTVCHLEDQRERVDLDELADKAIRERTVVQLPLSAQLISKQGQEIRIEGGICPIYDHRGKSLGTVLTLRNISSRIELEHARRQSEDQERQSQKTEAVRRLAGGVGHHLNNLMTVILGHTSQALSLPTCEGKMEEALEQLHAAGQHAASQIDRLLLFSGGGHSQRHQVDLNKLLSDSLNEVRPLLESEIRASFHAGSNLWPVMIDEVQVAQALLNLCLDAQITMPHGGHMTLESRNVTFTEDNLTLHPAARTGDFVRVRLCDHAHGTISDSHAHHIGTYFPMSEPTPGAANGVTFVATVMEQHHGWLECKSDAGMGTWFDLYFPRFGMEHIEEPIPQEKLIGEKSTILLAESDAMLRNFGAHILEAQGYRVLVAKDGVQAVTTFQHFPERIDLVIIDLNLPRLTGDAVMKRLLELDPNVEVLFSSGYFAADQYDGDGHLVGIIRKPYSQRKLLEMVEVALSRRREMVLLHGRIAKICSPKGDGQTDKVFGFISTCDGREVYFDEDSLVDVDFRRLEIQSEVRFIEELSSEGIRAGMVRLVGEQPHLVA